MIQACGCAELQQLVLEFIVLIFEQQFIFRLGCKSVYDNPGVLEFAEIGAPTIRTLLSNLFPILACNISRWESKLHVTLRAVLRSNSEDWL
jgi:hypothetical protein